MIKHKKALGFFTLVITMLGIYVGSQKFLKITYVTIEVENLSSQLEGMKILHITDLHSQSPDKMNVDIWKKAKTLDFDIACITGDIVDRNAYQIEPHMEGIKSLAQSKPVYFAEGNHDHYSMKKLAPVLTELGVQILVDEKAQLVHNGELIEVLGLSDFYTADLEKSAELFTKTDKFRLVMMHQPQHIDYVDPSVSPCLVLSGHTHGGQIRMPFFKTLYAPGQGFWPKYGYGTYKVGSASLFVSKGIGYTGKAPFRFWNRPEICLITLKAAS